MPDALFDTEAADTDADAPADTFGDTPVKRPAADPDTLTPDAYAADVQERYAINRHPRYRAWKDEVETLEAEATDAEAAASKAAQEAEEANRSWENGIVGDGTAPTFDELEALETEADRAARVAEVKRSAADAMQERREDVRKAVKRDLRAARKVETAARVDAVMDAWDTLEAALRRLAAVDSSGYGSLLKHVGLKDHAASVWGQMRAKLEQLAHKA